MVPSHIQSVLGNNASASPSQVYLPLTLIVATTPVSSIAAQPSQTRLGIGRDGLLPWPRIKLDMSFFARVTSRAPRVSSIAIEKADGTEGPAKCINVVIMGRKTYDSIPESFRPLSERFNVIISRDGTGTVKSRVELEWRKARERRRLAFLKKMEAQQQEKQQQQRLGQHLKQDSDSARSELTTDPDPASASASAAVGAYDDVPDVAVYPSFEAALCNLRTDFASADSAVTQGGSRGLGSVYVIGGAEIYKSVFQIDAKRLNVGLRVVMTDIRRITNSGDGEESQDANSEFGCDTFFPIDLRTAPEWKQASAATLSTWVGECVRSDWQTEGNVKLRMIGFEKVDE
ncbi:dihydrofolate reductase [Ascosphaera aggregata]|nr:dihydrofolate reductase [Ascosphaera aggregata]